MTERYRRYSQRKFKAWKERVGQHLPEMAIAFYSAKLNGRQIPYEKEKLLGFVIESISNPYYSIMDSYGKRLDAESVLASEVILEIQVSELFAFVKSIPSPSKI
jgi:hypothetical protein